MYGSPTWQRRIGFSRNLLFVLCDLFFLAFLYLTSLVVIFQTLLFYMCVAFQLVEVIDKKELSIEYIIEKGRGEVQCFCG